MALARLAGSVALKMPELHHQSGVGGRGDAAGGEVHHGQTAFGTDFQHEFQRRAVFLGEVGDFLFGQGAQGADFAEDHAAVAYGFHDVAGAGFALGADHGRAFRDAAQGLAEVAGAAHERHGEVALVDVETVVGGRQDFAFVDVVHAEGFEDAGFDDVPDAGLRHDRNGHRVHDAEHDGRIGHAGHAPGLADVGGNAFERHDGARARFLRDLRLFGGGDVHDDAAFHHFRQTGLELKRTFFHDLSP